MRAVHIGLSNVFVASYTFKILTKIAYIGLIIIMRDHLQINHLKLIIV